MGIAQSLPESGNVKMVDVWMIFTISYPFFVIACHSFLEVKMSQLVCENKDMVWINHFWRYWLQMRFNFIRRTLQSLEYCPWNTQGKFQSWLLSFYFQCCQLLEPFLHFSTSALGSTCTIILTLKKQLFVHRNNKITFHFTAFFAPTGAQGVKMSFVLLKLRYLERA